jgi:hypothetical protein
MSAPQLTVNIQGTTVLSADQCNTWEFTCDTIAELRGFSGTDGIQVFVRGQNTPGDGYAGPFIWTLGGSFVDDNVSTIVPNGASGAAWIRLQIAVTGPYITAGSGAPSASLPSGSIYINTSGGVGTRIYVSQGSGSWLAIAGV